MVLALKTCFFFIFFVTNFSGFSRNVFFSCKGSKLLFTHPRVPCPFTCNLYIIGMLLSLERVEGTYDLIELLVRIAESSHMLFPKSCFVVECVLKKNNLVTSFFFFFSPFLPMAGGPEVRVPDSALLQNTWPQKYVGNGISCTYFVFLIRVTVETYYYLLV